MQSLRILLVEDNEGDIILTLEALKEGRIPTEIAVVKDGLQALSYIESHAVENNEPDLILLDVNLPKMNGYEVLATIKNNPKKKHIPVLMFTTSSAHEDILKSYRHQADSYIWKPVDADDYHRVVRLVEDFWLRHRNKNN